MLFSVFRITDKRVRIMLYVFLADGFEEIEALATVDFLRRAGVEVLTAGVTGDVVCGAHQINVLADITAENIELDDSLAGVVLPGGMPGAENLNNSPIVQNAIDYCINNEKLVCAICAAPFVLGRKGILNGKKAICYPGFEGELKGAQVVDTTVVTDGNIITGRGPGVAWEFAAEISKKLAGKEKTESILKALQWIK